MRAFLITICRRDRNSIFMRILSLCKFECFFPPASDYGSDTDVKNHITLSEDVPSGKAGRIRTVFDDFNHYIQLGGSVEVAVIVIRSGY